MDFEQKLAELLERAGSVLDDVKWGTMRGQQLTLGTMTDDHLANSRHYHKHLAEVSRVAPEIRVEYDECKFRQFLMEQAINSRKAAGTWTIDQQDFRLA